MKKLFLLALVLASPAKASTISLTAEESAKVVEALLISGVKANKSQPVYSLEVKDLSCKARYVSHAGSPDDVMWGFAEYECSKPSVKGAAAKIVYETLSAIADTYRDSISISDCAMGKCYNTLKLVSCKINSDETQTEKRFSCDLTSDAE